ncbi:MAG: hypothetical protein Q9160_002976 [Pyrenula sp. 1 TL-2023]
MASQEPKDDKSKDKSKDPEPPRYKTLDPRTLEATMGIKDWGGLSQKEAEDWQSNFHVQATKLKEGPNEDATSFEVYAWLHFTKYLIRGNQLGPGGELKKDDLDWLKTVIREQKTPGKGKDYRIRLGVFKALFTEFNKQLEDDWDDLDNKGILQGKASEKFKSLLGTGYKKRGEAMVQLALKEDPNPEEFDSLLASLPGKDEPDDVLKDSSESPEAPEDQFKDSD